MGALRDIFERFAPGYVARFGARMPASHLRAVGDILACRTEAMGGHACVCLGCGEQVFVSHSCRHRMCPGCHAAGILDWIAARALEVLPVRYYHITFTLPPAFGQLVRSHQKALGAALIRSAAEALQTLAADRLGGRLGIVAALHTWGRAMPWHPHVHCLVPGLALRGDGTFTRCGGQSLLPYIPLRRVFAGIFVRRLRRLLPEVAVPPRIPGRDWVVNQRHCREGPGHVLRYLAAYAKRGPISDHAVVSVTDDLIVFRYRDHRTHRMSLCHLTPRDFLARYLQHTPPPGFHRIRYYGFLAPGARKTLRTIQCALLPGMAALAEQVARLREPALDHPPMRCPACGCTCLRIVAFLPPMPRGPPP